MSVVLTQKITAALAEFSSETRLYSLCFKNEEAFPGAGRLLVEAFSANDEVQGIGQRDIIVVSIDAHVPLEPLIGQETSLEVRLASGDRASFAGDITEIAMLGSDGGLARYRLRLSPWMWRLSQVRNCRVWQDKTVIEIVDSVFSSYLPLARWRWSNETGPVINEVGPLSYCCQFRESDLDFVQRLLAEAGLGWRFEQGEDGEGTVLFADSTQQAAIPEDASSEAGGGIRFHRAGACERQDTVQTLRANRKLGASLSTVFSYDYKSRKVVAASSPTKERNRNNMLLLESFDIPGQYAFASASQARRFADMRMERHEAIGQMWSGSSTLRTLRAGTRLTILDTPLRQLGDGSAFTVLRVVSVGLNNMPPPAQHALAELFGPIPELLLDSVRHSEPPDFALAVERAEETGYANCFEALPANVVWRPQPPENGAASYSRPTAPGSQTAIVVGADGSDQPNGADELYCDRFGRVRIRFHWQESGATCWVRVAQRFAGDGTGAQFLPRIGTEVLVKFLEGDIDRPVIVGALYNGQGEGGIAPTPGGRTFDVRDTSPFAAAHDHGISGQGNVAGGNSPVWDGASDDSAGHRNAAAQWGLRSKEFGSSKYNQLVFDDTDAQGHVQFASSRSASELNLGHLIHTADNYRGSFRGKGAELRTDGYGAIRAGAGLLISSYTISHSAAYRAPAGENAAGIAMVNQAVALAEAFSAAATTHQAVAFAAHAGTHVKGASARDANAAPLQALRAALSGVVSDQGVESASADAADKHTEPTKGQLPHTGDAVLGISAQADISMGAGQSFQLAVGESATTASGQDSQFVTGGGMRNHTGQAIGILGGALKVCASAFGVQLVAAKDRNDFEALRDTITAQARDEASVISANSHIDWAAAKRICMSTADGANITINGGNITVQCPGKITVHAGKKSLVGPQSLEYPLPRLPREVCIECLLKALKSGSALSLK
ncbi:type VI secretion system Vgr family protein [Massilia yuzhufengensis]|uniref:Rhs element Vgr protein n=1 Tax=Massilia yuzhufengensis TaxID=1164594 RepID=A0A1I1WKY9_9BURK|nr:type VI secretion system Vgr family protein [Massilia yuzhufengensis]SFD93760.1 Rhs element Vgr protein [Massilia yuzhufengensis]